MIFCRFWCVASEEILFAWLKLYPDERVVGAFKPFVWVQDGITRLIHEDLDLRFPGASSYFLSCDTSSLFTACGLDGDVG